MTKNIKVLFLTYPMAFHTPGGGEIQLLSYKKYLEKQGIEVDLFNPWKPNFKDYDIVHYFSVIGGSVHICNFIKSLGIPLVVSSSLWITENTKCLYPIEEIRHQLSLADIVIGNSDIECDKMSEILSLPRNKFKTIYNGVENSFFQKIDGNIFRNHFNIQYDFILNVANIEPRKNQLNLVKAIKKLTDKKLVLIGHVRDIEYGKKVLEEGADQVIHLGYLDNSDELLRSAFNACDVFCLPSTLETPGLAALEAKASGCNIVLTQEGATEEYFRESVYYCDPLSDDDIYDKIKLALNKKNNISSNIEDFKWSNVVKDLSSIYKIIKDID